MRRRTEPTELNIASVRLLDPLWSRPTRGALFRDSRSGSGLGFEDRLIGLATPRPGGRRSLIPSRGEEAVAIIEYFAGPDQVQRGRPCGLA